MSTQQTNILLEGLDPTGNVVLRGRVPLVPRLNTLVCKTIGLVWNGKPNANVLPDFVEELLNK